jgi:AraC family transcriptional regulator of adaptative response/methylated-DNA-[protein]-cysteine methyltransferase
VEFFPAAGQALQHGYRPCKLCQPLAPRGAFPAWMAPLMAELETHPERRLRDGDLRARGIEPSRLRRWFLSQQGMTFHAYQRLLRIGQAFGRIRQGEGVLDAAMEAGYESLSGFADTFRKSTGFPPSASPQRRLVQITRITSPLGPLLAGASDSGLCLLEFVDRPMLETQLRRIRRGLQAEVLAGQHELFGPLQRQLEEYFAGKRQFFDLPLDTPGSAFQQRVWQELRRIPYGATRSYQEQAQALGQPQAIRAVARANGDNRIAILIPCHRVIGKDGKLVGYGGGLWRKRFLLDLEAGRR